MQRLTRAVVAVAGLGVALLAGTTAVDAKPPTGAGPPFVAQVLELTPAMKRTMTGVSWKPGKATQRINKAPAEPSKI